MKRYKALLNQKEFDIFLDEENKDIFIHTELANIVITELSKMLLPFATNLMFITGKMNMLFQGNIESAFIEDNNLYLECVIYSNYNFTQMIGVEEEAKLHNFQTSFAKQNGTYKNIFTKAIPIKEVENNFDNEEEWLKQELNKIFNKGV